MIQEAWGRCILREAAQSEPAFRLTPPDTVVRQISGVGSTIHNQLILCYDYVERLFMHCLVYFVLFLFSILLFPVSISRVFHVSIFKNKEYYAMLLDWPTMSRAGTSASLLVADSVCWTLLLYIKRWSLNTQNKNVLYMHAIQHSCSSSRWQRFFSSSFSRLQINPFACHTVVLWFKNLIFGSQSLVSFTNVERLCFNQFSSWCWWRVHCDLILYTAITKHENV